MELPLENKVLFPYFSIVIDIQCVQIDYGGYQANTPEKTVNKPTLPTLLT